MNTRLSSFFFFIDLREAYNSVPCTAIGHALEKLGIPDHVIDVIHSFHKGVLAQVHIGGVTLEAIPVENGPKQRCTMAPVLSNL